MIIKKFIGMYFILRTFLQTYSCTHIITHTMLYYMLYYAILYIRCKIYEDLGFSSFSVNNQTIKEMSFCTIF